MRHRQREVDLNDSEAKLRYFKKQAKVLLKGVLNGETRWVSQAKIHPRFPDRLDPGDFKLSDAQLIIARQQGFPSWVQLKNAATSPPNQTGNLAMRMNYVTPELPVTNIKQATESLEHIGFRKAWDYEDTFACMFGGGNIEIFLRRSGNTHPVTLYLKVDNADEFYAQCIDRVELIEPIRETPWGMREFVVRVVDGHILRIGHTDLTQGDNRKPA